MKQSEINALINEQWNVIHNCEAQMANTDYVAAKIAEGAATRDHYAKILEQRQQWRDSVNSANKEIKRLEAIEPEPEEETNTP